MSSIIGNWKGMWASDLLTVKKEIEEELERRVNNARKLFIEYGPIIQKEYEANGRFSAIKLLREKLGPGDLRDAKETEEAWEKADLLG